MKAGLVDQFGIGVRDRLEVDIAAELMLLPEDASDRDELLHRIVRAFDDARGEKQALDIIAAIEGEGELHDFLRREARATDVRALPIDAIVAVEDAAVRQQDL